MSLTQLESEVQKLSPGDFRAFTRWLEEYSATRWDLQLESDVSSGKLAHLLAQADADFEAGKCTRL